MQKSRNRTNDKDVDNETVTPNKRNRLDDTDTSTTSTTSSFTTSPISYSLPDDLFQAIVKGNCVAFVGAGFSIPAKLPIWSKLLTLVIEEADETNLITDKKFIAFLKRSVASAVERSNADLYDLVAQSLEDKLGKECVERLLNKHLKKNEDLPSQMRERLTLILFLSERF